MGVEVAWPPHSAALPSATPHRQVIHHPKPGPKMCCSGASNVSGESSEEAGQGESNFCQNCIKGFPLKNCNKKGTKSFAKCPQGRKAHLTRELCSATTNIKDRAGIGILVLQSCCTAPCTQERAQRNLLQTAPVSPQGSPAFWAAGYC